jgi:hypothetical protein
MQEQYSMAPRFQDKPANAFTLTLCDAVYIPEHLAVEFWADVEHAGETVIVTGRYDEYFGDLEIVWVDFEALSLSHPLRKTCDNDQELRQACERAWVQHTVDAREEAVEP